MDNLAIFGGKPTIDLNQEHYKWPKIDKDIVNWVIEQLNNTISIYDNSWIIREFENDFATYHKRKFAITFNSWTSALYCAYKSLKLKKWDKIICPVYTFFATASPMKILWITPVLCDCWNDDWNINPDEIEKLIDKKTKWLVITHMWWVPCDMDKILKIIKKHNLILIEDCSHSHWAVYKWKVVWQFWDIAVWSLQWSKIITGGEWWILLTDKYKYFSEALLSWHYNKRVVQQIRKNDKKINYAITWYWLKLRAHPIAIKIASILFSKIKEILNYKRIYANEFIDNLNKFNFIKFPNLKWKKPSWYSFVFIYNEKIAKLPIKKFVTLLHSEWLKEFEITKTTWPIDQFALFWWIKNKNKFKNSYYLYSRTIRLPMWWYKEDKDIVDKYINWLNKVCEYIKAIQ